jgi:exopolysaccharide production protein ExoZ
MKKNNNIQVLRGFAALSVLFYHAGFMIEPVVNGWGFLRNFVFSGHAGVDIFFVISGYIIAESTKNIHGSANWGQFIQRRILRVIPPYYLVTFALFAVSIVLPAVLKNTHPSFADLLKSLLFIPHYNQNGEIYPVVGVGWSLNYELFFYVCMALAGAWSFNKNLALAFLFVTLAVIGSLFDFRGSAVLSTYTSPLLLEFLFGMAVYQLRQKSIGHRVALPLALALFLVSILFFSPESASERLIGFGIPSFFLVYAAATSSTWENRASRVLAWLGDRSYSLYLVHQLTLVALARILLPAFKGNEEIGAVFYMAVALGICVLVMLPLFYIERKSYEWLVPRKSPPLPVH